MYCSVSLAVLYTGVAHSSVQEVTGDVLVVAHMSLMGIYSKKGNLPFPSLPSAYAQSAHKETISWLIKNPHYSKRDDHLTILRNDFISLKCTCTCGPREEAQQQSMKNKHCPPQIIPIHIRACNGPHSVMLPYHKMCKVTNILHPTSLQGNM